MAAEKNSREQAKHLAVIHHLAVELGRPQTEIGRLYEAEFKKLDAHAKVKDFLLVLVERQVKASLKRQ
jgi:hypothetical protein